MALPDQRYIAQPTPQQYLVDKDTGLPLSGGTISYFVDTARTTPKNVYIQQQQPDNTYVFTNVGSVVSLSSVGTPQYLGTDFIPFLWPYDGSPSDSNLTTELYYVEIKSSGGVLNETREAWPPTVEISSSPPDTNVQQSVNIISNPQFAQVLFDTVNGSTISVTGTQITPIAPDWAVLTSGTGSFTVNQLDISATGVPGLPAFGLEISTSGLAGFIYLVQTISNSPRLQENSFVSGTFIANVSVGSASIFTMEYLPSSPTISPITVAAATVFTGGFQTISGAAETPTPATNTDPGSTGYIQCRIKIPAGITAQISCVQMLGAISEANPPAYIQQSTPRQIDALYHYAYPIVPIGAIIDYAGFSIPQHYFLCDGSAKSRVTYYLLYRSLTTTQPVTWIDATSFTVASSDDFYIGMSIEGADVAASTTITGISGTTITISPAATATGTTDVTFFAYGNGDGSTTFNLPLTTDCVIASSGGSLFGPGLNGVGYKGGSSSVTLSANNLPAHTHAADSGQFWTTASGGTLTNTIGANSFTQAANTGNNSTSNTPVSIVQNTILMKKCIRYE